MAPGQPIGILACLAVVISTFALARGQAADSRTAAASAPVVQVEVEEQVYAYTPANNGAGPMWCSGSTSIGRVGTNVFATALQTIPEAKPLNNCGWTLYKREPGGWAVQFADTVGRTREPSPLAVFSDGRVFVSANPTLSKEPSGGGPARPEILQFSGADPKASPRTLLPGWGGQPAFTEHSYRSFAADGSNRELILFQNIGYTHAEWAFLDSTGNWSAHGQLRWPEGKDYPKPEPIRVCYPNVALKKRAVHFCGVSDIIEPYPEWRAFKKQLTGQEWDYDFRRLFYTWTSDVATQSFRPWIEIASRDKTCGWVSPGDLWVGPDEKVHLVWTERALDERLRAKFFPDARQSHQLNYAVVEDGKVVLRRTLMAADEGKPGEIGSAPRFHATPDHRLFVVFYVSGTNKEGRGVSENRLLEILPRGQTGPQVRVPLKRPFTSYFTATPRAGSAPSEFMDLLGVRSGAEGTIAYARLRLSVE